MSEANQLVCLFQDRDGLREEARCNWTAVVQTDPETQLRASHQIQSLHLRPRLTPSLINVLLWSSRVQLFLELIIPTVDPWKTFSHALPSAQWPSNIQLSLTSVSLMRLPTCAQMLLTPNALQAFSACLLPSFHSLSLYTPHSVTQWGATKSFVPSFVPEEVFTDCSLWDNRRTCRARQSHHPRNGTWLPSLS